jgi:hypothetical protein
LLARLSQDERHAKAAAEATQILGTLKHSLQLARDLLANQLNK